MSAKKTITRAGVRVSSTRPSTGSTAARTRVSRKTQSARPPRTAYDLLARVCAHILEEPKRYTQETYVAHGDSITALGLAAPACGTVACRAGWIVALHDGPPVLLSAAIAHRANEILGVSQFDTYDLFSGAACDHLAGEDTTPIIGTKKYAQLGVKGLQQFMRTHATHLKARLLKDVPKADPCR